MLIDFTNFQQASDWAMGHSYFFIFLIMCAEGPITTAAAGFAAALGYFNPWAILAISVLGDLVPDSIYYLFGYLSRLTLIEKIGFRLGLTQSRIDSLEDKLKKHFGKSMVILKLTPVLPTFGFMLVGYLKLSFIAFTKFSAAVTVPKSILFLALGYFFGRLYDINQYLHYAEIFFPAVIAGGMVVFAIYKKMINAVAKKIEKL
ncbi:MAG: VTT domain-containing protein [Parcubacteria group bacterium]